MELLLMVLDYVESKPGFLRPKGLSYHTRYDSMFRRRQGALFVLGGELGQCGIQGVYHLLRGGKRQVEMSVRGGK